VRNYTISPFPRRQRNCSVHGYPVILVECPATTRNNRT
jgi:hypothetical protein